MHIERCLDTSETAMAGWEGPMTSDSPAGGRPEIRSWRRRLASIEAAAIAGLVCAAGWSIGLRGLLEAPGVDATDAEIVRFYNGSNVGLTALLLVQVVVVATIGFLWFVGVVRSRLGRSEPRLFATVFFGSSVLLAGVVFTGTAALAAPAVLVEAGGRSVDPGAASMMRALAVTMVSVFAPRVATLVMFSTAALSRKTRALPRWLIIVTYVVGIAEFVSVTIARPTIYVFPAWIALVSVTLLVRHQRSEPDEPDHDAL